MRVTHHIAVSTVFSGAIYAISGSLDASLGAFFCGWIIDCDHLLDYVIEHGAKRDPAFFFRTFHEDLYRCARLPFHGWEWPIGLCAAGILLQEAVLLGMAAGWLQHLVFDQALNGAHPLGYSLAWRMTHGFGYRVCFPKNMRD